MSAAHSRVEKPVELPSQSKSETETHLHGYKLMLARTTWVIIAATALALSVLDIPHGYAQYLVVCTQTLCPNQEATPELVRALHSAGLSLQFYAIYLMVGYGKDSFLGQPFGPLMS